MYKFKISHPEAIFIFSVCMLCFISVGDAISCYNCSSVNHDHCPAEMSSQDEDVVPLVSCDSVYEAQYCVKTNGVTGGCQGIQCFRCEETFHSSCSDALFNAPLSDCKDVFDANYCVKTIGVFGGCTITFPLKLTSVLTMEHYELLVPEKYETWLNGQLKYPDYENHNNSCPDCGSDHPGGAKIYNRCQWSLGITRFCSSRDMGNYCEYIRRPGDQLEYRSCVFTCTSDGCNKAGIITASISLILVSIAFHFS